MKGVFANHSLPSHIPHLLSQDQLRPNSLLPPNHLKKLLLPSERESHSNRKPSEPLFIREYFSKLNRGKPLDVGSKENVIPPDTSQGSSVINTNLLKTREKLGQKSKDDEGCNFRCPDGKDNLHKKTRTFRSNPHVKNRVRQVPLEKVTDDSNYLTSFNYTNHSTHSHAKPKEGKPLKKVPKPKQYKTAQKIDSKEVSESSTDEYEDKAVPGPGSYNFEKSSKGSFRSKRKNIQDIFFSKIARFRSESTLQEPTSPQAEHWPESSFSSSSHNAFFLSKLPKFFALPLHSTPPPGYYNTRQTLENDLICNILKSSNSASFISCIPRSGFQAMNVTAEPGPGSYDLNVNPSKLNEDSNYENFYFKSNIPRQLSYIRSNQSKHVAGQSHSLQLLRDREGGQIHVKPDLILEDELYSANPPFLSSSERFPALAKASGGQSLLGTPRGASPMKTNKVSFNSSSRRQLGVCSGDGVGVGMYSSPIEDSWLKKSHNIRLN